MKTELCSVLEIWSISRLPDLQMNVQDPAVPAPATVDPPATPPAADPPKPKTETGEDNLDENGDWISELPIPDNQKKWLKKTAKQNSTRSAELNEAKAKLSELEKKEADRQRKQDEEQGNWKKIAEENEQKLKAKDEKLMRAEVRNAAIKEGIVDPSLVDLLPMEGIALDEQGNVSGAEKLIAKYKKEKAYLFGAQSKAKEPEGTTSGKPTPAPNTSATPKDALKMSDADFQEALKKFREENR